MSASEGGRIPGPPRLTLDVSDDDAAGDRRLSAPEILSRVSELVERHGGAEVRTERGSWRSVVAVYSDRTVGTVRLEEPVSGRFTIVDAEMIADVHEAQVLDQKGEVRAARR